MTNWGASNSTAHSIHATDHPGSAPREIAIVCPGCHGANSGVWGEKRGFRLSRCRRCYTVFTPLKYSEGLEEFYDRYYIAPQALEYGERRGWVVTADAEVDSRFPEQGFDVVTMIEFLEHIPDPDNFLRSATRWLRPGGALYLTTPNANSINRRLIGLDWSIFNPPERLTIWTARGLSHALARAGLRPRRIRTEGFNPSEILARRVRPKSVEVNRNQTAVVINQAFSSSSFRRAIKTSINHCLSALRVGDSLKVWAVHNESRDA